MCFSLHKMRVGKENQSPDQDRRSKRTAARTFSRIKAAFSQRNLPKSKSETKKQPSRSSGAYNVALNSIKNHTKASGNNLNCEVQENRRDVLRNENNGFVKDNSHTQVNPFLQYAQQFGILAKEEVKRYEQKPQLLSSLIENENETNRSSQTEESKGAPNDNKFSETEPIDLRINKEPARLEDESICIFPETYYLFDLSAMPSPAEREPSLVLQGDRSSDDSFFEVDEYRTDIYKYLLEHELRNRPEPDYMNKQPDITPEMRTILVEWLVDVCEDFRFQTETLFLAVNYLDRFLSCQSVLRAQFHLVGTAALFLAGKYEEKRHGPRAVDYAQKADNAFDTKQITDMEFTIMNVLNYEVTDTTPVSFITSTCVSNKLNTRTMYLAMYLNELTLLDTDVRLRFPPSVLAASAIAVARHTLDENDVWNEQMIESTGYDLAKLEQCVGYLSNRFAEAPRNHYHTIQEKYQSLRYMSVASLRPNTTSPSLFEH